MRGYSGDRLTANIGPMASGTAQYTGTLASASLPIRPFKVSVSGMVGATTYTLSDIAGDGNLYGSGGDWGTINYTTGAIEVNFDGHVPGAGDVGNAVTVTWSTNFEAQTEIQFLWVSSIRKNSVQYTFSIQGISSFYEKTTLSFIRPWDE